MSTQTYSTRYAPVQFDKITPAAPQYPFYFTLSNKWVIPAAGEPAVVVQAAAS